MTDHNKIYVYTGSETGYTAGNWYYWNGSVWTSGGVYNSVAVQTDASLTVANQAADAQAAGKVIVVNSTSVPATRVNITTSNEDIVLAEQSDVDDLKNALKTVSVFFPGNGTTYTTGTFDVIEAGHTYRVYINSWDVTGMSMSAAYTKFTLGYTNNGATVQVVSLLFGTDIASYYDITVPDNAVSPLLFVGGRVVSGKNAVLYLDDITINGEVDDLNGEVDDLNGEVDDLKDALSGSELALSDLSERIITYANQWMVGYCNPINGEASSGSQSIFFNNYLTHDDGIDIITANSGYGFSLCAFDSNGNFIGAVMPDGTLSKSWSRSKDITQINLRKYPQYKFKLTLFHNPYNDSDVFTTAEKDGVNIYTIYGLHNEIDKNRIDIATSIKSECTTDEAFRQYHWHLGYRSPVTGAGATSDTNIFLNDGYFFGNISGFHYVECASGYEFNVVAYQQDGTFVGAWDGTTFSKSWYYKFVNGFYLDLYPDYKFSITLRRTDGATMTTAEYSNVSFWRSDNDTPYMITGRERIESALKAKSSLGNIVVIGFDTDQHIWYDNKKPVLRGLKVLSELTRSYPYDFICLGGDACEPGNYSTSLNDILDNCIEIQEPLYDAWCPVVPITGNHDAADNNANMTGEMLFNAHFKRVANSKFLEGWDNTHTNGYWDSTAHNIRFIFFDDTLRNDYTSTERTNALQTMLAGTPNGYNIVIFSHHVLSSALSDSDWLNPVGLQSVLAPYATRIICCICGHVHYDVSETSGGILYISTTTAQLGADIHSNNNFIFTESETAFDTFVIDQDNKHIYALRYGRGSNRDWTYTLS